MKALEKRIARLKRKYEMIGDYASCCKIDVLNEIKKRLNENNGKLPKEFNIVTIFSSDLKGFLKREVKIIPDKVYLTGDNRTQLFYRIIF